METTNNFINIYPKDPLGRVIDFPYNFIHDKSEYKITIQDSYGSEPNNVQKLYIKMNILGDNYISIPYGDHFKNVGVPLFLHQDAFIENLVRYICYLYNVPLRYHISHQFIIFGDTPEMNIPDNILLPNLMEYTKEQFNTTVVMPFFKMNSLLKAIGKPDFSPCIFLNEQTSITIHVPHLYSSICSSLYDELLQNNPDVLTPKNMDYFRNKNRYSLIALELH